MAVSGARDPRGFDKTISPFSVSGIYKEQAIKEWRADGVSSFASAMLVHTSQCFLKLNHYGTMLAHTMGSMKAQGAVVSAQAKRISPLHILRPLPSPDPTPSPLALSNISSPNLLRSPNLLPSS